MTAALDVEGLTVAVGNVTAVADVSFAIAPGEVLGMVGESGAGKSLTGAAVLGLLEPPVRRVAGRIVLGGQRIDDLPEAALRRLRGRRIGAVFQDPMTALNPLLTVGRQLVQTITTHLPLSRSAATARAVRLLGEVGIPDPAGRLRSYPHQLSGGMRQRVMLALAFACDPAVVIADEPTTALDVCVQAQVIALLRRMGREHQTAVLLITHDLGVIARAADRLAVLYAGRVVEMGTVASVLSAPAHPYSRGLVASVPPPIRLDGELPQIAGAMPRPGALPPGCAFHPRCPERMAVCTEQRPALLDGAACWLAHG